MLGRDEEQCELRALPCTTTRFYILLYILDLLLSPNALT